MRASAIEKKKKKKKEKEKGREVLKKIALLCAILLLQFYCNVQDPNLTGLLFNKERKEIDTRRAQEIHGQKRPRDKRFALSRIFHSLGERSKKSHRLELIE